MVTFELGLCLRGFLNLISDNVGINLVEPYNNVVTYVSLQKYINTNQKKYNKIKNFYVSIYQV